MKHIKLFENINKQPITKKLFNTIIQKIYNFVKSNTPQSSDMNLIETTLYGWLVDKDISTDDGYYYYTERMKIIELEDAGDLIDCCLLKYCCYTKKDYLIIPALDYVEKIDSDIYLIDFYSLFFFSQEKNRTREEKEVQNIDKVLDKIFEKTDFKKHLIKNSISLSDSIPYNTIKYLFSKLPRNTFSGSRDGLKELSIMYRDFDLFMIAYSDFWGLKVSTSDFLMMVTYFPQEIIYFLMSRRDRYFIERLGENLNSFVPRMVEEGASSIFEEFIEVCKEKNWDLEEIVDIINGHSRLRTKTKDRIIDSGRKEIFKVINSLSFEK